MAKEKEQEEKSKTKVVKTVVVPEIPTQPIREVIGEKEGEEFNLVTKEEALTEILEIVRELKKLL